VAHGGEAGPDRDNTSAIVGLKSGVRECLVVVAFIAFSVLHTWPIAADPARLLPPNRDTRVHVWALDEMSRQLVTSPWRLFDTRTFHPYPDTLATVDHVFADAVLAAPLRLFTDNPVLIYNIVLLATFVLCGFFTYRLVRALTASTAAGLLSGCAFAYATFRWHQLPHLHLLSAQWLPLALLLLHRALAAPRLKSGAALAAAGVLVALSSWHMALLGAVAIIVVATWTIASQRGALRPRLVLLGAVGVVVLVSMLPFAVVYLRVANEWRPVPTAEGRLHELSSLSLKPEGLIAMPPTSRASHARTLSRFADAESQAFPGVVTLVFALLAVFAGRSRRSTRVSRTAWIAAACLLAALCGAVVLALSGRPWFAGAFSAVAPMLLISAALVVAGLTSARAHAPLSGEGPIPALGSPVSHALTYTALAIAGLLLALGPQVGVMGVSLGTGLFREDWVPILSMIRTPARFVLLTALGGAVLAGLGLKWVSDRLPVRRAAALAAVAVVLFNLEVRHAPLDVDVAEQPGPVEQWLAQLQEPGAVVQYPLRQSHAAVHSGFYHRRPMVNGIGFLHPPALLELPGDDALSPRQLGILWEHFHPRFVVVRGEHYEDEDEYERVMSATQQPGTLELRWQHGRTRVLELIDRGAGPVLFRRWPRSVLVSQPTLEFAASVSGGDAGTISTLTVELNGTRLLERHGIEATTVSSYQLALPSEALVDGSNTVEIRGDYRHANQARAVPVGTTGVSLAADASITSAPDQSYIQVNGRGVHVEKGYALVVVDPATGVIISVGRFNTSWFAEDADRMADFINGIPTGSVVLVATEFDVSRRLNARAVAALRQLGLSADLTAQFGWQQAAAGVKGARPGTALEFVGEGTRTLTLGTTGERRVQLEGLVLR
jgi:hypothetical protein